MILLIPVLFLQLPNVLLILLNALLEHPQLIHDHVALVLLEGVDVLHLHRQRFVHEKQLMDFKNQLLSLMVVYVL